MELTAKPISIKDAGCKFGGGAPKAIRILIATVTSQTSRYSSVTGKAKLEVDLKIQRSENPTTFRNLVKQTCVTMSPFP